MTIASAFNDITEKLGGTPSNSGTIASAIDALNDVLAGSDQPAVQTIEGAVALLGEHIGGGSSVTVEALTATENKTYTAPEGKAYSPVTVNVSGAEYAIHCYTTTDFETFTPTSGFMAKAVYDDGVWVQSGQVVNKAEGGEFLIPDTSVSDAVGYYSDPPSSSAAELASGEITIMPKANLAAVISSIS